MRYIALSIGFLCFTPLLLKAQFDYVNQQTDTSKPEKEQYHQRYLNGNYFGFSIQPFSWLANLDNLQNDVHFANINFLFQKENRYSLWLAYRYADIDELSYLAISGRHLHNLYSEMSFHVNADQQRNKHLTSILGLGPYTLFRASFSEQENERNTFDEAQFIAGLMFSYRMVYATGFFMAIKPGFGLNFSNMRRTEMRYDNINLQLSYHLGYQFPLNKNRNSL